MPQTQHSHTGPLAACGIAGCTDRSADTMTDHEYHGGAAGSFASEGCEDCQRIDDADAPQIETVGAGSAYNDQCSHAVNSDCPHYS